MHPSRSPRSIARISCCRRRLSGAGDNEATFTFVSDIAPTGASIIRSHDPDGSDYLYTLLVPADANQLFPCFDQPDLKARVTFTLTAPVAWRTLANGAEARADTSARWSRTTSTKRSRSAPT